MTPPDTTYPLGSGTATVLENDPQENNPSTAPIWPLQANDSGYSTQANTPVKDPPAGGKTNCVESILFSLPAEGPPEDKNSDTNSGAKLVYEKAKPSYKAPTRSFPLYKKKTISIFDQEVDEATNERFKSVQTYFEKLLLQHVRENQKAGAKYKPMSTRLAMMGPSHNDTTPHIIVFCQPEQKRLVQRFVKKDIIEDICRPREPGVPSFRVKVIGNAPQLKLAISPVEVTAAHNQIYFGATLCGAPISFTHSFGMKCNATFGGIIKVVTEAGDVRLYGITAGHAVLEWHDELQLQESTEKSGDDSECHGLRPEMGGGFETTPQESDSEGSDLEDSDVEMSPSLVDALSNVRSKNGVERWSFANPIVLGSIITHAGGPGYGGDHEDGCYDWALFETKVYQTNKLPGYQKTQLAISDRAPGTTGKRSVHMVSGSGIKRGRLSSTPGRILVGSGEEFVDSYMLTVDDWRGICDGDSDAWVIDSITFEVYGHLIAMDMFGSGYVIPLKSIFDDIKRHLRAQLVELPSEIDVLHARTVANPASPLATPPSVAVAESETMLTSDVRKLDLDDGGAANGVTKRDASTKDSGYSSLKTTPFTSPGRRFP